MVVRGGSDTRGHRKNGRQRGMISSGERGREWKSEREGERTRTRAGWKDKFSQRKRMFVRCDRTLEDMERRRTGSKE